MDIDCSCAMTESSQANCPVHGLEENRLEEYRELEFRPDECEWFEACEEPAAGDAAHPDKGVIPVCAGHVKLFGLRLIGGGRR